MNSNGDGTQPMYHADMEHRILKDPICGMTVTEKSFHRVEQQGQTHYFCGPACKTRFVAHGLRHADAVTVAKAQTSHKLQWISRRSLWLAVLGLPTTLWLAGRWLHSQ